MRVVVVPLDMSVMLSDLTPFAPFLGETFLVSVEFGSYLRQRPMCHWRRQHLYPLHLLSQSLPPLSLLLSDKAASMSAAYDFLYSDT